MKILVKNKIMNLVVIAMFQTLIACNPNINTADNQKTIPTQLDGTWLSDCIKLDSKSSILKSITITGPSMIKMEKSFNDSACTAANATTTLQESYAIAIVGKATSPANTEKMDLTFKNAKMAVLSTEMVTYGNNNHSYGYSNWVLNQFQDITGKNSVANCTNCDPMTAETKIYSIYTVEGNNLYLGMESSTYTGVSEQLRHQSLDYTQFKFQ